MQNHRLRLQGMSKAFYLVLFACIYPSASQAVTIAQQPIYLQTSDAVEPNIILTIDDSGSMDFDYLTSDNSELLNINWKYYSSAYNKLYYNPTIRYRPWINGDGSEKSTGATQCIRWRSRDSYHYNCGYAKNDGSFVYIWNEINNYAGGSNRTDCSNPNSCTFTEEQKNYANWVEYYSTRLNAAKAGIGRAFYALNDKVRIGYGTINTSGTILSGVQKFTSTQRTSFFNWLYNLKAEGGTPLRRAMDDVGQYFLQNKGKNSPWADNPGENNFGEFKTCRQSFHILMTDGYWTNYNDSEQAPTTAARDNIDNQDGENIPNDNGGKVIQYKAIPPFKDDYNNTLADVANYYWKRDLQPQINNKVNASAVDPAYWQHLVNFTVSFGLSGSLDYSAQTLEKLVKETLHWPNPHKTENAGQVPEKIDDLWHAAINSYGGFFSAADPEQFVTALTNAFAQIQARVGSSSAVASNSTKLSSDTAIFQAKYNTANWTGDLTAYEINENTQDVGDELWVASEELSTAANRKIYTLASNGSSGKEFIWNQLTKTQKDILGNENALNWIRGVQTNETTNGGTFRARTSLLGDIINSSPVLVSNQYYGYGDSAFTTAKAARAPMVYVGANDGMLHGFDAETGEEKFAYIPQSIFSKLPALMATTYTANHQSFVDGNPKVGDAEIQNHWKTVLLGSTGAGGKSVFALDVTDPDDFGSSTVMWEYNSGNDQSDMGYSIPQPTFSLVNGNDTWSAIIPNGYNSTSNQAKLILLNLANGSAIKTISTNEGDSTYPNGLSTPIPVDINSDRKVDYIYAGDLRGNLWRFDVADSDTANWTAKKIFTACSDDTCTDTNRQPITVRPEVVAHNSGGVLVLFGTGSDFATEDRSSTQVQAMYAVRDTLSTDPTLLHRTDLVAQTITDESMINGVKYRVVSQEEVNYENKQGWYLNVISPTAASGTGERIVNNFSIDSDKVIFTTTIPSTDPCDYGGKSWLMELSLMTGKRLTYSVFDSSGDDKIDDDDSYEGNPLSGRGYDDVINTPTIIKDGSTSNDGADETKFISSSSGAIHKVRGKGSSSTGGRQSWQQLR